MKYMFNIVRLPDGSKNLLNDIQSAAERLCHKLQNVNTKKLKISDYNKRYFGHIVTNMIASLQLRSYILCWSLSNVDKLYEDMVFIDYGGGSGTLSLLAKELGIGTVIYNDIYETSCHDAQIIAQSIQNDADYYVQGEIDELLEFTRRKSIPCDAIASYDVIEHIYDIEGFFKKLHQLSSGPMTVFMSSGANMINPRQNRLLQKEQIKREYYGREEKWGIKPTDCLKPFIKVRTEMISNYLKMKSKNIDDQTVDQLARRTRGKIERDIYKCIDEYLKIGELPSEPIHPTNTCNPYNGNWAEHLLDPCYLQTILSSTGFHVDVLSGYYGRVNHILKRIIGELLNFPIFLFKKQGLKVAPFYTIYGYKN